MTPATSTQHHLRTAFAGLFILGMIGMGCGGKVVFVEGSSGGAGGSGGSDTTAVGTTGQAIGECVLGVCGGECSKCVGSNCFAGKCDANRICQPPTVDVMCTK
jgi:hypothetical protein